MATRLYLSASQLPGGGITPGFAAWTRTTEGDRRAMTVAKDGTTIAGKTAWAGTSPAANGSALFRQFISPPMAAGVGFVTTDTIRGVIQCIESAANDNINRQPICLKVYAADGTTLQSTLFALAHAGPATTEWVVTPTYTARQIADGDVLAANYTTTAGDRLVLEIGGQVSSAAGTSVTGTIKFGSNNASDLAENETATTEANPWFEISRDITFLAPADNGDEAPWFTVRSAVQTAMQVAAATLFTTQVALAAGAGWLPDELAIESGIANVTPSTTLQVLDRSVAMPVPWYWHQDALPAATLAGDEGAFQPPPVRPGFDLAWLSAPTGGYVTEVAAEPAVEPEAGFVPAPAPWPVVRPAITDDSDFVPVPVLPDDEGAFLVVPFGPAYILLPPPSGGSAPEPITSIAGAEGEYRPVPPPLPRPVPVPPGEDGDWATPPATLAGDEGEAPSQPVAPWLARPAPIWDEDGYPTAPAPLVEDEGTYFVMPVGPTYVLLPPPSGGSAPTTEVGTPIGVDEDGGEVVRRLTAARPLFTDPTFFVVVGDDVVAPPAPALSEDHYQPPAPRGLEFGLAWLSVETGGYAPEVAAVPTPDEDAFLPAPPINVRPVVLPVWDNENEFYLAPFFLDEDLDPDQIHRALPPVWKAVRPVWGFWDVDEARVTPVFPSGGQGTGRTHLFLGQIPDSATPTSAAGALYVLTGGYGEAAGTDTPLVIETPDVAPLGQAGRLRLRRIAVPFQYAAACTIKVTPIVDYMTELDPVIITHGAPGEVTRHLLQIKTLTACTVVRLRIEIMARAGAVEFYRPSLFFSPLSGGTTMAMGGAP